MIKVFIIAEMGVNHNGSLETAKALIATAARAGADAIKTQSFNTHLLASKHTKKAEYQQLSKDSVENQSTMLRRLEITPDMLLELKGEANQHDIELISTPFDIPSVHMLSKMGQRVMKIPSGEITNLPYLIEIGKLKKSVIMSTGMSELHEIGEAVAALVEHGTSDITLLHCNTEYPTPFEDANLRAMETLRREFNLPVGYSDHTPGIEAAIAAVALGATVIEKHFTLDRNMEGPDHKASIEPDELAAMVCAIRNIEAALGDGVKRVMQSEQKNMDVARKSIVAARDIRTGEVFTEDNITTKRPGNGISPMKWFNVLGQKAKRDFREDELIEVG